jgi:spore germination cell wall hydrolase CwlJ-like protein
MGRRLSRRMWYALAALVPLPLLGFGYAGVAPVDRLIFEAELWLSGKGSAYPLPTIVADAAHPHQPLAREADQLFRTSGKGPRADQYHVVMTTTYADKRVIGASMIGVPDLTGSLQSSTQVSVSRDKTGARLNPPVTEVALKGSANDELSAALFMSSASDPMQLQGAFDVGRSPPSAESIAYHPSAESLSFKSAGESQAEFQERERRCLATAIYFEARGEPVRGQIAVGQVILNRVRSPQFPETICGVVYQGQMERGCQFSFACDGHTDMPRDNDQWALAQDLSRQITSGQVWLPEVGYSTYYHANYVRPGWVNSMSKIDSIGRHIFYKKRNETPYIVEQDASATPVPGTATEADPQTTASVTPTVSLASATGAPVSPTPATSLTFSPSE